MMRILILLILACLVFFIIMDNGTFFTPLRQSESELIQLRSISYQCGFKQQEISALTMAAIAVEVSSTSALEIMSERVLAEVVKQVGFSAGNFSVGIGQIRPSTAIPYSTGSLSSDWNNLYIKLVYDECFSLYVANSYLIDILKKCRTFGKNEDECTIYALIKYNGQKNVNKNGMYYIQHVLSQLRMERIFRSGTVEGILQNNIDPI